MPVSVTTIESERYWPQFAANITLFLRRSGVFCHKKTGIAVWQQKCLWHNSCTILTIYRPGSSAGILGPGRVVGANAVTRSTEKKGEVIGASSRDTFLRGVDSHERRLPDVKDSHFTRNGKFVGLPNGSSCGPGFVGRYCQQWQGGKLQAGGGSAEGKTGRSCKGILSAAR